MTNDFRAPPSFERRAVYSGLRTSTSSSAPADTGTALSRAACAAGPGTEVCVAGAAVVALGAAADAVAAGRAVGAVGFGGGNRTVQPIRTAAESAKARTRRFVSKGSPLLQGTGSGPPAWNGWQRASRRAATARRSLATAFGEASRWRRGDSPNAVASDRLARVLRACGGE